MKNFLFVCFSAIGLSSLNTFAQTANHPENIYAEKYAIVNGHKIHYQSGGTGEVTVVLVSGLTDDLGPWYFIYPEVAKFAKVIRYDRPGYGSSDTPAVQPNSFKEIAATLHELLQQAGMRPPYVLVGHSMAGAPIRAFAYLYKDETAGLVFVDPFNEYGMNGWSREQTEQFVAYVDSIMNKRGGTRAAESNICSHEVLNGYPELNSYGGLPDIPVVLMVAGKNGSEGWEKNLMDLFEDRMSHLSNARLVVLPSSPHYMQQYDPFTVIDNIRRVAFADPRDTLQKTLHDKGVDSCVAQYKKMAITYPKEYMTANILNDLGYEVLNADAQGAIKLFALNVQMFPDDWNMYDSLGEAYMNAGDKDDAIKNYEKSIELNPDNINGVNMLKKLRAN